MLSVIFAGHVLRLEKQSKNTLRSVFISIIYYIYILTFYLLYFIALSDIQ